MQNREISRELRCRIPGLILREHASKESFASFKRTLPGGDGTEKRAFYK
jgi:hypothetical protein